MNDCATHIGPLARAVAILGGPVWELGVGWYSTSIIHALFDDVVSFETDLTWAEKLRTIAKGKIVLVKDWEEIFQRALPKLAFIDCYTGEARIMCATLLLEGGVFIVAHDTEQDYWNPVLRTARFVRTFDLLKSHTSYLSNLPFAERL
jgi:hypothetical protein